ncbi:MAG: hypothetical protein QXT37_06055 [Thermofilaceae archaeon]
MAPQPLPVGGELLAIVALAAGFAVGWAIGAARSLKGALPGLDRGDALAIVLDLTSDSVSLVPVERVGESIYLSRDGSLMLLAPTKRVARTLRPHGRPVFLACGVKASAAALSPEALASVGIASISLGDGVFGETKGLEEVVREILAREGPLSGRIPLSSETTLAIAFTPPALAKSVLTLSLEPAEAAVRTVLDAIQFNERLQRLMIEQVRARAAAAGAWLRWLLIFMLAGGVVALLFYVIRGG